MIPCDWQHDPTRTNARGWPVNVCKRCGYERYAPHHPSTWKGDPQWCPSWPRAWEWGHWLTLLLAALGLRKEGYVWLKRRLGLTPKCGCGQRAERLNTWGHWFFRPRRG